VKHECHRCKVRFHQVGPYDTDHVNYADQLRTRMNRPAVDLDLNYCVQCGRCCIFNNGVCDALRFNPDNKTWCALYDTGRRAKVCRDYRCWDVPKSGVDRQSPAKEGTL